MAVNGQRPIAGVVSSDFSFNRLAERILATEHPYPGAYYMLIGTDGRYLVHPETRLLFKKTIFSETDPVSHPDVMALGQEMTLGKEGTMHVTIDDALCHVSYAPIPGTNWSLALVCPDKEILADYHYLGYLLIGLVILGLFLIRWLTYRVVKQNIKPVNQLLEITEKITEGNYDEVIPRSDRKDAIAKMQNGFADMQQSIITHMKDIAHATEELKMQTAELEEAVKEADEAARKRELFIQNVLHQINTPLNIIEGLANVLCKSLANRNLNGKLSVGVVLPSLEGDLQPVGGDLQPVGGDLQPVGGDLQSPTELGSIASTMKHYANILNRKMLMLFDCSNTSAAGGTLYHRGDKVACNAVAQECIDHTNSLFQGLTIRFETEVPDSLCIQTNHLYLMRTLREPVYNAAKYSDGQHIVVRVTQTDTTVRFIVEDVGPGLPKEWQELVNQPFAKVNEQSEGLGLGLPLSKRHAIGLGGDLIYDPDYEGGCRFIVEVPKQ
jgi:signal transduction histidine kinase